VLASGYVNKNKIRKRKFKAVVDCVNSSGSKVLPALLEKLGCKVYKVDCTTSGIFTRNPEPIPENLKKTCAAVKKNKADIGIVVDPDGDRLVIITEEGKPFSEENTITTVINHVFKLVPKNKRIAAVNLSTSRSVDDIVKLHEGRLYKSPVGEINVIKKMKEVKAVVGGEGSGGVILPEIHYGRDALAGAAVFLSELAEFGGKVSEYKKQLPEYYIMKSKMELSVDLNEEKVFNYLKNKYGVYLQNSDDGLRIDFDNSWVNFRKSNTEPIMRIITEAKSAKESETLLSNIMNEIRSI
jgi:phosphomannomutase